MRIFLALGSNYGNRAAHLTAALQALPTVGIQPLRVSAFRGTAPLGATGRAHFLNAVAEAETTLLPGVLLSRLRLIERAQGRRRLPPTVRKTPRTLDLDLILYGRARFHTPVLTLPHPRFASRPFVLDGLAELAPTLRAPATPRTTAQQAKKLSGDRF